VTPCLILGGINAWNLWDEHWEHWKHLPPLEERVEYPYQNIRTKNFPWGDGDKTLLYVLFKIGDSEVLLTDGMTAGTTRSITTTRTRLRERVYEM
jgi:Cytochrome c oxidase subunit VIa